VRRFKSPAGAPLPVPPAVVLDANALRMPFQFRVNLDAELLRLLGECDVVVPEAVIGELRRQAADDREAQAALRLAAKYRTVPGPGRGDESVVLLAQKLGAVVVTNDAGLLFQLRRLGIPRISLRARNHLVLEGLE